MYTLVVVRTDGIAHTTKTEGFYRESLLDTQFNDIIRDKRTRYAVVFDDTGSIRREFHATVTLK